VGKASDCFTLNWNRVLIDFLMKSLAKSNDVVVRNRVGGLCGWIGIEPESHVIKKMKTGEINERGAGWFFLRSEKDCGREDTLKPIDQALVVGPILGQAKELEHLGRRIEMDCPVFLLEG
jgi:hypothetical protein